MEAIRNFFRSISVEPAFLIFAISQGLYIIVSSELYITKVCKVNLALGDEVCNNIQQHKEEQVQVQRYAATLKIYNNILQAIPAVVFALFAGAWSDTNGRKFLIVSSLFGFVFNNAVFMINTYWFYELKAEYLLFECLQDCTGGMGVFFMAMNSYMADVTSEKTRTKRLAFMNGLWPVGFNIGKALSGVIKSRLGFMYNFAIGMLLSVSAMTYVQIMVEDSFAIRDRRLNKSDEKSSKAGSVNLKTLFRIDNLKQGFITCFKKRPLGIRALLLAMIFCLELEMFINVGQWSLEYLYLRRRLEFTMSDYTRYSTIVGVVGIAAQYVSIPILAERFKVRDSVIALIAIGGSVVQQTFLASATAEWMLYMGAAAAFLEATTFSLLRSMMSKNVRYDEIGKLLSVVAALQATMVLVATPVFGLIYRATVATFPQAYIVLSALLFVVDWLFLMFIDRRLRRKDRVQAVMAAEVEMETLTAKEEVKVL